MAKFVYALAFCALLGLAATAVIDPECPEHEFLSQTTPMCPVTCQTRRRVHCLGLMLKPSCQCAPGYTRDSTTSKCIPTEKCPEVTEEEEELSAITPEEREKIRQSCDPATEVFSNVTPVCPARCFAGRVDDIRCLGLINAPSCQCRSGYVRDALTHQCILATECKHHLY